jgi:lipopolysaccharide export system protein LptA
MKRFVLRTLPNPSSGRGWKGIGQAASVFVLLLFAFPARPEAIEHSALGPLGGDSLGKSLQGERWNRNAPVDIHSEEMTVDFDRRQIAFKGDVKVLQADFSLTASEVTAVFGESADDIQKIVAVGDVKIQKGNKTAWGEKATYTREDATILLTGNPVLKQGRNFIKGGEILVRLDEDRMEVRGDVKAEFVLSEQQGATGTGDEGPELRDQGSGVGDQEPPPDVGDRGVPFGGPPPTTGE